MAEGAGLEPVQWEFKSLRGYQFQYQRDKEIKCSHWAVPSINIHAEKGQLMYGNKHSAPFDIISERGILVVHQFWELG